jgi:hypothetical protein
LAEALRGLGATLHGNARYLEILPLRRATGSSWTMHGDHSAVYMGKRILSLGRGPTGDPHAEGLSAKKSISRGYVTS